ncbi:hypothetical protein KQI11_13010, partial [Acetanaerobacterium sp. MSJ-12]|uniref:hypothetical protein n=1 Tax=Acetanaerobacterium sp. MSJ-12 TaxID=2841535 RepID=UPI001C0F0688
MRKQKWRGLPARLVALGLAAALCLGMSPVSALAEGEEDPSGDDSSSEFVGSDSFENLFGFAVAKDQKAYTYQNFLALANPRKNDPMTYGSYNTDGNLYSDSQAYSKANISLLADWEFVSDFTIISSNVCNHAFAGFSVGGNSVRIGTSRGKNEISHFDGGADATVLQRIPLDLDKDIKGTHVLKVTYKADGRILTVSYGHEPENASDLKPTTSCALGPHAKGDTGSIAFKGQIGWPKSSAVPEGTSIQGNFISMRYTHYTPQFVSTELLDEDGNTMSDEEKLALQDGDVVTV